MAALDVRLVRDTLELVNRYNRDGRWRERSFIPALKVKGLVYKSRPLLLYVKLLASLSPTFYNRYYQEVKHDQTKIEELLKRIYLRDRGEYQKLQQASQNPNLDILHPELRKELEKAEKLPVGHQKNQHIEQALEKHEQQHSETIQSQADAQPKPLSTTPPSGPTFAARGGLLSSIRARLPRVRLPVFAEIGLSRLLRRLANPTVLVGAIGAGAGFFYGGPSGALVGGMIGGVGGTMVSRLAEDSQRTIPPPTQPTSVPQNEEDEQQSGGDSS